MSVPLSPNAKSSRGFTLIEALIVVALMGILSGVIIAGSGLLGNARLRASASLVLSAVRLGVSRANAVGQPVRLVFDLEHQRIVLEETAGRLLRSKDDESAAAGAEPATDAERAATEYAKGILDGPRVPRPRFRAIDEFKSEEDGLVGRGLGEGVEIRLVQTEHDNEPRTDGRAYVYFWPGGGTERAVIQLRRAGDDEGLTVLVSPLTGRAKIQRGLIEFGDASAEHDFGVREAADL